MKNGFDPHNMYTNLKQSLKSFLSSEDDKDKQKILKKIKELKDNENKIIDNAISE